MGRRALAALAVQALLVSPSPVAAWDYSENGLDWARQGLGLCGGGGSHAKQSPIDLPHDVKVTNARQIFLKYPRLNTALHVYNTGRSIAFTLPEVYKGGFGFTAGPDDLTRRTSPVYRAWQVSFHSPSEHTLGGRRMPLEMQMVHKRVNGDGGLAIMSVLFEDAGTFPSPFLATLVGGEGLPRGAWDDVSVNFAAAETNKEGEGGFQALFRGSAFYGYEGSLTVPPCETGVRYFVRQSPVPASTAQLREFAELLRVLSPPHGNFRATPLSSAAGLDVILVGSVDVVGGLTAAPASKPADALAASAAATAAAASNPALSRLLPGDSPALVRAKEQYQQALMEVRAAEHDKTTAERELRTAEVLFNTTIGLKEKIAAKGKVQSAGVTVRAADDRISIANHALQAASMNVFKVAQQEANRHRAATHPDGIAEIRPTAPPPVEPGSDGRVITTVPAHTFGIKPTEPPKGPLNYKGAEIVLPTGLSANPFFDGPAAQAKVSIGAREGQGESGGLSAHETIRLAPNLRQYDGPVGSVEVPRQWGKLVEVTTRLRRGVAPPRR